MPISSAERTVKESAYRWILILVTLSAFAYLAWFSVNRLVSHQLPLVPLAELGDLHSIRYISKWGQPNSQSMSQGRFGSSKWKSVGNPIWLTPLGVACIQGHSEIAALLISEGADIHAAACRPRQWPALHLAAFSGHADICQLLIENGADPDREVAGDLPVYLAFSSGDIETVELFLKHVSPQGAAGWPWNDAEAFRRSLHGGNAQLVQRFIDEGFDVNQNLSTLPDQIFVTAPDVVGMALHPNRNLFRLLADAGCNLDAWGNNGMPALFAAAVANDVRTAEALLDCGANVNVCVRGNTPLDVALGNPDRNDVASLLKARGGRSGYTIPTLEMRFIPIPVGAFVMGSPLDEPGRDADESQYAVELIQAFWISQHEVTQEQWEQVMASTIVEQRNKHIAGWPIWKGSKKDPMYYVDWFEAVEFCRRLTAMERHAGRLPADQVYRLPSEAEWEYCCRAGSSDAFSFGNDVSTLDQYAWYYENSGVRQLPLDGRDPDYARLLENGGRMHTVGAKAPNRWGLYDMHGNMWEWCHDRYGDYPSMEAVNPVGPKTGTKRVARGGSWYSIAATCRSADRYACEPDMAIYCIGFRVLRGKPLD